MELAIEKPIIKAIKESDLEEIADQNELEEERKSLVAKWSDYIFRYLKKPESFAPQYFSKSEESEFDKYAPFR